MAAVLPQTGATYCLSPPSSSLPLCHGSVVCTPMLTFVGEHAAAALASREIRRIPSSHHTFPTASRCLLDASRLLRQIARCQCPHVSRTLARVSSLSSRNIFSPLFTALSGCNGNVRTFFECRTYVVSVLGILTFCPIFSLCGHIS